MLVLITREDPPFPLAKMRATKRLFELRISQLRFTEEEVKTYFLQQLHISLEEEQIQHLITRTVEVEEISSDKPLPLTPKIVGKRGQAPDQYGYGY